MTSTTELRAAKNFGPGYFIREQMELRDWTQSDLSEVIGITVKHLNKILQDKQPLTLDMARLLGKVFNTSARYWLNLDTGYRLWLAQENTIAEKEAGTKAMIYERMPVKDMLAKGWLKPYKSIAQLQKQVIDFWHWKELDFSVLDDQMLSCLKGKSEDFNQFNASYAITWYQKAFNVALNFPASVYQKQQLETIFDNLHTYTLHHQGIEQVIRDLASAGVIFFVLPPLQKTTLDAAAFFRTENPVIVYSARNPRIDNFWFTLAHEIAHIQLHLNEKTPFILDNLKDGKTDPMEKEANNLAAEKLRHPQILDYLTPHLNYLTKSKVEECAAKYEIHPSVIIGKLTREKKLSNNNLNLFNENVLNQIPGKYKQG